MAWLPHGEKISKISLFVLAQLTNVTDRRTERQKDRRTPHAGNSRAMHNIARQSIPPDTFSGLKIAAKYVCGRGWGSLQRSPRPPSCTGGGAKGKGWKGKGGQERGRDGRAGQGRGGKEREEGKGPHFLGQVYAPGWVRPAILTDVTLCNAAATFMLRSLSST